jgi:hypothetical protein
MTDETYPNKDIYYLPEKTPVYIITNPQDPRHYANYKKTARSFERAGYKDIRLQSIVYTGEIDTVEREEFPSVTLLPGLTPMTKKNWLLFLRMMRKAAGYNGPIVVTTSNALLVKDIHKNREAEGMFALGGMPIGAISSFRHIENRTRKCLDLNMGYVVYPRKAKEILNDVLTQYVIDYGLQEGFPLQKFIPMDTQIFPTEYEYMVSNDDIPELGD